ncbi:MAG TPA: 3-(methylthio)propionyl-CoA ligase [Steroidobacteraceae bacterium]|jgi:fatty-acyl-CoA synthase
MLGQMMDWPLLISSIVRHAELQHPRREIVSITSDQPRHRYTYREAFARARRLANALRRADVRSGDRIATLAWNDYRHLEIYYAVSCSGFVCHTINPRLFEDQIVYIANHAEDRWLFLDPAFVPLVERLLPRLPEIEAFVILTDDAHLPQTTLPGAISYESLLMAESDEFEWPDFDERTASSLCYTSGTTGDPKGVLFSHRSTILHCYSAALPDSENLSGNDVMLAVVPMFHVNAWGLPYVCPMVGSKLVLPGVKMGDAQALQSLIEEEQVTHAAAVPTVWQAMVSYLDQAGRRIDSLKRVLCGGSAVPVALMDQLRDRYGVEVTHAWGMTETSPIGTVCSFSPEANQLPQARRDALRAKQGRAVFGIELKVTDEQGREMPRDGKSFGALKVRGPWVASGYFHRSEPDAVFAADGWFDTGDVATICPLGYMQITDRTKDVIKSGGEWISSIELENIAVAHPAVAQAAAIAFPHPKWQERPLLVVVPKLGQSVTREELLDFLAGKVAKWWIPDDVVFVEKLPLTATGKLSKLQLRQQFSDYRFPETE